VRPFPSGPTGRWTLILPAMTPTDHDLRARVEQLETDRDTMYAAFRAVDGEFHDAVARHRADRTLIAALRSTQIEHGEVLAGLVVDVSGLKSDVSGLKSDVSGLKSDVSGLKSDVSGLKSDVSGMTSDVSEMKVGQLRLERLIRRGLNLQDED
jgi:outer membrane murein-binding lipoprotein Lpp